MNEHFISGFEKNAGAIDKIKSIGKMGINVKDIPLLFKGRSLRNLVARHAVSKTPYVGNSEILQSLAGGFHQNKVKNKDLLALAKNIGSAGKEVGELATNKPGRFAKELAIGGGLGYVAHKGMKAHKKAQEAQQGIS